MLQAQSTVAYESLPTIEKQNKAGITMIQASLNRGGTKSSAPSAKEVTKGKEEEEESVIVADSHNDNIGNYEYDQTTQREEHKSDREKAKNGKN